jgi:uncharacterized damage-inducible protein DinB
MSERARSLADEFERANNELIGTVEGISDGNWRAKTAVEGWTVGVVAHHVAEGHKAIAALVHRIATGQPVALDMAALDRANAEHARQHANCTKPETLALLRQHGAKAAETVRDLSDAQLDRVGGSMGMTAAQVIERILIGHVREHRGSIRAALGAR